MLSIVVAMRVFRVLIALECSAIVFSPLLVGLVRGKNARQR
jgi:hypothetical protein